MTHYFQIPFYKQGEKQVIVPMVKTGKKENPLLFIIDSGAECNVMSMNVFNRMYDKESVDSVKKSMAEGKEMDRMVGFGGASNTGPRIESMLLLCKMAYRTTFVLINTSDNLDMFGAALGEEICGVIGSEFMQRQGWILDYQRKQLLIPRPSRFQMGVAYVKHWLKTRSWSNDLYFVRDTTRRA